MTTTRDTAILVGRYVAAKMQADRLYAEVKEMEFDLISALREEFPEEWSRWERGIEGFTAHGITIPVKRTYDADKVRAEFGEERPDLVTEETKVVVKVDGKKLAPMWRDAAMAQRLEKCLVPATPSLKIK